MVRRLLMAGFVFCQMVSFAVAQDTIFVSCWTGKNLDVYRSRGVKSKVISSATGDRAYVAVNTDATGSGCLNVTRLFVAGKSGEFHQVFEAKSTTNGEGIGMQLIGWNRSGDKLLAELGRWTNGSDSGFDRELILYEAKTSNVSHVDVAESLSQHFGPGCAFDFETKAWHEPDGAIVLVKTYEDFPDESLKSCVQRPTQLVVNLSTGAVSSMPGR